MRTRVFDLELTAPRLAAPDLHGYATARVLARVNGCPVGWVRLRGVARAPLTHERVLAAAARQLGDAIVYTAARRASAVPTRARDLAPITVVVCTRDRPDRLDGCLAALRAADYPAFELVVVDNASLGDDTRAVAERHGARCVREDHPGLDWARNRGIAEAAHPIVAFTDDDVRVDRGWLRALGAAFREPDVMAATGLIAPAELETEAQTRFELDYGGMVQALHRRVVRRGNLRKWDVLWAGSYGAGANMAFRREVFDKVGLFDVALDVGTPSGGGGDLEMLQRVVARGHALVYEPAAVVWHHHRREMPELQRQIFDNGRGFACYLLTAARTRTFHPLAIAHFALRPWLGGWLLRRLLRPRGFPRRLVAAELAGALLGPYYYLATRRHARAVAERGAVA